MKYMYVYVCAFSICFTIKHVPLMHTIVWDVPGQNVATRGIDLAIQCMGLYHTHNCVGRPRSICGNPGHQSCYSMYGAISHTQLLCGTSQVNMWQPGASILLFNVWGYITHTIIVWDVPGQSVAILDIITIQFMELYHTHNYCVGRPGSICGNPGHHHYSMYGAIDE